MYSQRQFQIPVRKEFQGLSEMKGGALVSVSYLHFSRAHGSAGWIE